MNGSTAPIAPQQLDIFYNTINLEGAELKERQFKAGCLASTILDFFKKHPDVTFTPFEVQSALNLHNRPITSIRRAITDLTPGHLIKTDIMRPGELGSPNHTWALA